MGIEKPVFMGDSTGTATVMHVGAEYPELAQAAKVMQNGKLLHIEDSGHNLHHDQLARTTEVIEAFFCSLQVG